MARRTLRSSGLIIVAVIAVVCAAAAIAQQTLPQKDTASRVVVIHSDSFKKDFSVTVVLPASYEKGDKLYALVVLLHGVDGDHTDWPKMLPLAPLADKYQRIIVAPTAGPNSWWVDHGGTNFAETFVTKELIASLKKQGYRIRDGGHWISGNSMGGWGALHIGLAHPELFSAVGGLSACITPARWKGKIDRTWGLTAAMGPAGSRPALFNPQQITELAKRKGLVLSLLCGQQDGLFEKENNAAHAALEAASVPHQWQVLPGKHNAAFWMGNLPKQLEYFQTKAVSFQLSAFSSELIADSR
ncbi:MAG: esterase family protein [Planctomycetaceae bacterium]|nr:esterase family protein [Planctomycetaceae bacterium]